RDRGAALLRLRAEGPRRHRAAGAARGQHGRPGRHRRPRPRRHRAPEPAVARAALERARGQGDPGGGAAPAHARVRGRGLAQPARPGAHLPLVRPRDRAGPPRAEGRRRREALMRTLVLLRHGESTWNLENRFTGWTDVDLSALGREEALSAGRLLRDNGFTFDVAYTSVLRRAIKTLWLVLEVMELEWIPEHRAWQLNERHYGALQGLNKAETAAEFGEAQVNIWRR